MIQVQKVQATGLGRHRNQLIFLLAVLNCIALIVFLVVHVGVYGTTFKLENSVVLLKLFLTASAMAAGLHGLGIFIGMLERRIKKPTPPYGRLKIGFIALLVVAICFMACTSGVVVKGIYKDLNTGITTTYSGLKPETTLLVMNDEEIHHTDIPFGESFTLVNKNVKGFTEKDGRFAVGCALTISDSSGKVLLQADDLFKDKQNFTMDETKYLECIINTGKPMNWDEHYKVQVRFWDKWGTGSITNDLKILINGEVSE